MAQRTTETGRGEAALRPSLRSPETPNLIIGVGNLFRRDDGVGLRVAQAMKADPPAQTAIVECGDGASLIDTWEHADSVTIVDAALSGVAPGTVHRLDAHASEIPTGMLRCSTHNMGMVEAIALARLLGKLPRRLIVFGIEVEDVTMGEGLSPAVADAALKLVQRIRDEIKCEST